MSSTPRPRRPRGVDDAVICDDQTFTDERGRRAVEACREHDGVSALTTTS